MITFNVTKTDGGPNGLLGNTHPELWCDERERLLLRVGTNKGVPEVGSKMYSITYETSTRWMLRCIEIIKPMDGRPRSNKTTSISLPAGIVGKGQFIYSLFQQIEDDVKNDRKAQSPGLVQLLQTQIGGNDCIEQPKNNLFGCRYYSSNDELLELFDNLYQKEYLRYQTVYFIPKSDTQIHPDEKYVMLSNAIDKIQTTTFEEQSVGGITFKPEKRQLSFFASDASRITISWMAQGYKTIVKPIHDYKIAESDIYRQVAKSQLFRVTPLQASIICLINGQKLSEERGYFNIPFRRVKECKFRISYDGYEEQTLDYPDRCQPVILKKKQQCGRVRVRETENREKEIEISYYPVDLESCSLMEFVLCKENLLRHDVTQEDYHEPEISLQDILRHKLTIAFLVMALLIGGIMGYGISLVIAHLNTQPSSVQGETAVTNDKTAEETHTTNPTEQQMIETYLAQDKWRQDSCKTVPNTKEPDGLYEAMLTYDYDKIKEIYNNLDRKGYACGKLKEIVDHLKNINSNFTKIKKPQCNYETAEGVITLDTWKQNVIDAKMSNQGNGETHSSHKTNAGKSTNQGGRPGTQGANDGGPTNLNEK